MKPVVIVDANAIFGLRKLTDAEFGTILALARTDAIRLVVPDVVALELARQGAKEFNDKRSSLRNAAKGLNDVIRETRATGIAKSTADATVEMPQLMDRAIVHRGLVSFLHAKKVETPAYPELSVADLLERDLAARKPFDEHGKGFRDTLIWATIRSLCDALEDPATRVVFVTNNYKDFCAGQGKPLHSHLREELAEGLQFDVVENLRVLTEHETIAPLVESLRFVERLFTPKRQAELVDDALADLNGREVESTVGIYDGGGTYDNPLPTRLNDTAFDDIMQNGDTIVFEVFRTGEGDELTARVTVEADCSLEGFIDKTEFYGHEGEFSYAEDWNRYAMRVSEPHRVRFTLSGDFAESAPDGLVLTVDGVEEIE